MAFLGGPEVLCWQLRSYGKHQGGGHGMFCLLKESSHLPKTLLLLLPPLLLLFCIKLVPLQRPAVLEGCFQFLAAPATTESFFLPAQSSTKLHRSYHLDGL